MLSGVSLLAVSNVKNPVGLVGLPYVMWSAHFFFTHIQTEKISSWNGPTVHVCCFILARAFTETFVSRVRKTAKKSSLAGSLVSRGITVLCLHVCMHSSCPVSLCGIENVCIVFRMLMWRHSDNVTRTLPRVALSPASYTGGVNLQCPK
jgi:hypothetical protein